MSGPAGRRNGMWRQGWKIAGKRNGMRKRPDSRPRGERNGAATLCREIVRAARELHRRGEPFMELARFYHCAESTIRRAVKGQTWGHVA